MTALALRGPGAAPKFDGIGGARGFENLTCAKFDNLTGGAKVRQNLTYYPALARKPPRRGGAGVRRRSIF